MDHCLHWSSHGLTCCFCGWMFWVKPQNRVVGFPGDHGIFYGYLPNKNRPCWVREGREYQPLSDGYELGESAN